MRSSAPQKNSNTLSAQEIICFKREILTPRVGSNKKGSRAKSTMNNKVQNIKSHFSQVYFQRRPHLPERKARVFVPSPPGAFRRFGFDVSAIGRHRLGGPETALWAPLRGAGLAFFLWNARLQKGKIRSLERRWTRYFHITWKIKEAQESISKKKNVALQSNKKINHVLRNTVWRRRKRSCTKRAKILGDMMRKSRITIESIDKKEVLVVQQQQQPKKYKPCRAAMAASRGPPFSPSLVEPFSPADRLAASKT